MLILKFGGSSVGAPERILKVADIVASKFNPDASGVVVVSAMSGMTDLLFKCCKLAAQSDAAWKGCAITFTETHIQAVRATLPVAIQSSSLAHIKATCNELEELLSGIAIVSEATARTRDLVASFGERLSAYILAQVLLSKGLRARYIDAREVLVANDEFGNARVLTELSRAGVQQKLNERGTIAVVTGYIGASVSGETVTFGRGGSDYTAAALAELLDASMIEIWTDVDGFMSADPRKVPQAFRLQEVSFNEAMELCHFGAKVIYPPTLQPALRKKIPIKVLNTFKPEGAGTFITYNTLGHARSITGVTSVPEVALIRVEGSGMIGVSGISARLFSALAEVNTNVILITQASSEQSICVAVSTHDAAVAVEALSKAFAAEIREDIVRAPVIDSEVSIISAVGENMRQSPGVAAALFSALGKQGINVAAIAQGSSELSISVVVSRRDEIKALQSIHDGFFLSEVVEANIFLAGPGLIGKTLLRQLADHSASVRSDLSLELKLVGLIDSKRALFNMDGIPCESAYEQLAAQGTATSINDFTDKLIGWNKTTTVFVDCTASETFTEVYPKLLRASCAVVTSNKKVQSTRYTSYRELKEISVRKRVPWLFETSVGAGLPVISTLNDLIKSGDRILSIDGVLSGTLSYIFSRFSSTVPFSNLVKEAREQGYTEPDPREDLNGKDVARKILILAREAGEMLELRDIEIEDLVPEPLRTMNSVEEFLAKLPEYNAGFQARALDAEASGMRLRYIASYQACSERKLTVSLQAVNSSSPFWSLDGNDNMVAFTTERYSNRPLVIRGPGAGAEVTAAGVFADIIKAAL